MSASAARCSTIGASARSSTRKGVAALFAGASGTGKTMAAEVARPRARRSTSIASTSPRVVSKYIGETEKNLDASSTTAERAGAVLLFDEADALFGKRSEVQDTHDRYANIEVAYLLQRMEQFAGLAILTTNLRENLDPAFTRRLRFIVELPAARRPPSGCGIWEQSIPPPIRAEWLDLKRLAFALDVTGGIIRQMALHAAMAGGGRVDDRLRPPARRRSRRARPPRQLWRSAEARRALARDPAGEGRLMAIDAVTAALVELLQGARSRNEAGLPGERHFNDTASALPNGGAANADLALFLYRITPSPELRNAERVRRLADARRTPPRLLEPAVPLDLHYLVTTGAAAAVAARAEPARRRASGPSRPASPLVVAPRPSGRGVAVALCR